MSRAMDMYSLVNELAKTSSMAMGILSRLGEHGFNARLEKALAAEGSWEGAIEPRLEQAVSCARAVLDLVRREELNDEGA